MKKTLGNLLLFFGAFLIANPLCDYNYTVSNDSPYLKEGVELRFHIKQKDRKNVMFFDLLLPKSGDFKIELLGKKTLSKKEHQKEVEFHYRLIPLKPTELNPRFTLVIKSTSDESIEGFATGSRDVIGDLLTDETKIDIDDIHLNVKPIKEGIKAIGEFTISSKVDKTKAESFEQINLIYEIKGEGYNEFNDSILPPINGVESFLELTKKPNHLIYKYALFSDKNFTVPSVNIKAFDPKNGRYYTLKTKKIDIKISPMKEEDILDDSDSLPDTSLSIKDILPFINGILIFIAGYLTAKLKLLDLFKRTKQPLQKESKLQKAKTPKELLRLLLSTQKREFEPFIKELEEHIYKGKKLNFTKLKDELSKI
jgi:hypothetical protein